MERFDSNQYMFAIMMLILPWGMFCVIMLIIGQFETLTLFAIIFIGYAVIFGVSFKILKDMFYDSVKHLNKDVGCDLHE